MLRVRIDAMDASREALERYSRIPISYQVREVFDLDAADRGPAPRLVLRALASPYIKDYDSLDGGPTRWPQRFDVSGWRLWLAMQGGRTVGGAAIATDADGTLDLAEGRSDLAVLWDLRVAPDARGQGVGTALFRAVEAWTKAGGLRTLKVETQNINVPACRFYARRGLVLRVARRGAYPELPDEVQLLWYKDIGSP